MKKPDRFADNVMRKSQGKTLDVLQDEWIIVDKAHLENEEDCACGQHLKSDWMAYYVYNAKTKKTLIIGACCIKKFNPRRWNSKKAYLFNAHALARNDTEIEFVMDLINRLTKYGSGLIISKKQASWLESITGKEWKWRTWET